MRRHERPAERKILIMCLFSPVTTPHLNAQPIKTQFANDDVRLLRMKFRNQWSNESEMFMTLLGMLLLFVVVVVVFP